VEIYVFESGLIVSIMIDIFNSVYMEANSINHKCLLLVTLILYISDLIRCPQKKKIKIL